MDPFLQNLLAQRLRNGGDNYYNNGNLNTESYGDAPYFDIYGSKPHATFPGSHRASGYDNFRGIGRNGNPLYFSPAAANVGRYQREDPDADYSDANMQIDEDNEESNEGLKQGNGFGMPFYYSKYPDARYFKTADLFNPENARQTASSSSSAPAPAPAPQPPSVYPFRYSLAHPNTKKHHHKHHNHKNHHQKHEHVKEDYPLFFEDEKEGQDIKSDATPYTAAPYDYYSNPYIQPIEKSKQQTKPKQNSSADLLADSQAKVNQQPMYIMDRYGNLYPYQPYESADDYSNSKPASKEIDASQLIRMLLGNGIEEGEEDNAANANDVTTTTPDSKVDAETHEKSEADDAGKELGEVKELNTETKKESSKVEETPLTRRDLADIISKLSKEEIEGQEEAKEDKVDEKCKQPCLKVHKCEKKTANEETSSNVNKPIIVNDVKVSAPQLKKANLPFSPPINVYDFDTKYIVVVSLPGVKKEFVSIDFHPTTNELIIEGEAQNQYLSSDQEDEVANSFIVKVSEQRFGSFKRVIKLPGFPGVDENNVKAKFINGMLEIKLPKVEESKSIKKPRKVVLEDVPDEELERETQEYV